MNQTVALITITVCRPDHHAEIKTIKLSELELQIIGQDNPSLAQWVQGLVNRASYDAVFNALGHTREHSQEAHRG